jgi:hypothetical protein
MRLPAGIQDFTHLREENMVYVDKTMLMQPFLEGGRYFFARPRRFGKSLLLSTLKAAFVGRKDLFKGLWLEHHFDFVPRPVIRLDFSKLDYKARPLEKSLLEDLRKTAQEYGLVLKQDSAKSAFEELIYELSKQQKVVVLIDEYDKPITDHMFEEEKRSEHQATLKSVYGVLKPMDAHLHLVMLTGVSKIGKLSLFSDLNNLLDISMNHEFALICGYTRAEIESHFMPWLLPIAKKFGLETEALFEAITYWYNGYSWDGENRVYCPYSFLVFLSRREFASFWYETGSPSIIINLFRQGQIDIFSLEKIFTAGEALAVLDVEALDTFSLMFQTGYLSIQSIRYSLAGSKYTLSYPNNEVRVAFSRSLLEDYGQKTAVQVSSFAIALQDALLEQNWETLFGTCNRVLAGIPYEVFPAKEAYMHSLMHLLLTSSGLSTQSQVQTSLGRMDTLVKTPTHSIILEFKIGGSAKDALLQIDEKQYAASLEGQVVKIGVVFDLEQKKILEWAAA